MASECICVSCLSWNATKHEQRVCGLRTAVVTVGSWGAPWPWAPDAGTWQCEKPEQSVLFAQEIDQALIPDLCSLSFHSQFLNNILYLFTAHVIF